MALVALSGFFGHSENGTASSVGTAWYSALGACMVLEATSTSQIHLQVLELCLIPRTAIEICELSSNPRTAIEICELVSCRKLENDYNKAKK